MKPTKTFWISIFAAAAIAIVAVIILQNQKQKSPILTPEEIFAKRKKDAESLTLTPQGIALFKKDWVTFDQSFVPEKDLNAISDLIRAGYIDSKFDTFTPADFDQLWARFISSLEKSDAKNFLKQGLVFTQFQRLPLPTEKSAPYEQLKAWALNSKTNLFLRKNAFIKLLQSSANVDPAILKNYLEGFKGNSLQLSKVEWLLLSENMRSVTAKKKVNETINAQYSSFKADEQPIALYLMASTSTSETQIEKKALALLQRDHSASIEMALRILVEYAHKNSLHDNTVQEANQRLARVPTALQTPYFIALSKEWGQLQSQKNVENNK